MIDVARPVHRGWHWLALVIRDRGQRHLWESHVERPQIRQIKAPVKRCYRLPCELVDQWKLQEVDVKMQDVEFSSAPAHPVQHNHVIGNCVLDCRVQPQCRFSASDKFCASLRVTAGEKRDLMPLLH